MLKHTTGPAELEREFPLTEEAPIHSHHSTSYLTCVTPYPLSAESSLPRRKLSVSSKSGVLSLSFTSLVTDGIFHFYDFQVIPFFPAEQYAAWRQELCLVCFPASTVLGREKAHGIILVNRMAGPPALQMCTRENIKNTIRIPRVMKHNL